MDVSFVYHRMRRRKIEGLGTMQLTVIVLGRWSDRRSSSTAHSPLVSQMPLTLIRAGVLSTSVALTVVASLLSKKAN